MTILPRASSRQRPSKALIVERLEPCNLNDIFFLGYTVVAAGRPANNLILKLEPTGPAVCPKCGFPPPCEKLHDTRCRLVRDEPYPGVTVVWVLVSMRRVRCECGCRRAEVIPWIAHTSSAPTGLLPLSSIACGSRIL